MSTKRPFERSKAALFHSDRPAPGGHGALRPKPTAAVHPVALAEHFGDAGDDDVPPRVSVHQRLLDAARERFAADGYENATTASIARQAGTSESQLVKHFGSKEGLLEAVFDAAWAELDVEARQSIAQQATPLTRLLAVGDLVTHALERDRKWRSIALLESRRVRKNADEVILSSGFRRFLVLVDDLFRQISQQGDFVADVHLEAVRSAWVGAVEGMVRDQLLGELMGYPATFNRRTLRRTSIQVLCAFLTPRAQRVAHAYGAAE